MPVHVTKDEIQAARQADLFEYLSDRHPNEFRLEYGSLRMIDNHSISIRQGYSGYKDFATGETGNSVDFLTRHLEYEFTDAVRALNEVDDITSVRPARPDQKAVPTLVCPAKTTGPFRQLYAYLLSRGIQKDTIKTLIQRRILYQDDRNNLVFINPEHTWGERRGTNTYAEQRCMCAKDCPDYSGNDYGQCRRKGSCERYKPAKFRGILPGSAADGYWRFTPEKGSVNTVYICESSIDAVSLYEIHRQKQLPLKGAAYVSIGGAGKQEAIERLKDYEDVIIAVDNDPAGDACRNKNRELEAFIPVNKDWNEDLQKGDLDYDIW